MKKSAQTSALNSVSRIPVIIMILSSLLFLGAGCGNEEENAEPTAGDKSYQNESFAMNPPEDWEQISTFTNEYPEGVIVGFRESVKNKQFTPNIVVFKKTVGNTMKTKDFAKQEVKKHEDNIIAYKETRQENVSMKIGGDNTDTILIVFEGKQNIDDDTHIFMQIFGVKDGQGYVVIGGLPKNPGNDLQKAVEDSLKSFELK